MGHSAISDSVKTTDNLSGFSLSGDTETGISPVRFQMKPYIGLGVGNLTFYGDIARNHKGNHFTVSRLASELRLTYPLTPFLNLEFNTLFGRVSANERSLTQPGRNLNFESRIRAGGLGVTYNFDHFIKPLGTRSLEPFVYLGIESFEFLSKTDLFDANGAQYHYWSDGSIMNMAEDDPNARNAVRLQRDYTYETDLREQNLDGLGHYPERSWAIPVGIGTNMYISPHIKLRVATTFHFSFTDLVDNVVAESNFGRNGDKRNDHFLFSSITLSYSLQKLGSGSGSSDEEPLLNPWEQPLFASDTFDTDMDGVVDFQDVCAYTPTDCRPVYERGCEQDSDFDGVPDCKDLEPNSKGPYYDEHGVSITDEMITERYLRYKDSTGEYSTYDGAIKQTVFGELADGSSLTSPKAVEEHFDRYFVILDKKKVDIKASELYKYLQYKEFTTVQSGDSVYYVLGTDLDLAEATRLEEQLNRDGIATKGIGSKGYNDDGSVEVTTATSNEKGYALEHDTTDQSTPTLTQADEIVYRVQLGAFGKEQEERKFIGIPDVVRFVGEDGTYRYFSGVFDNLKDASMHKIIMTSETEFIGSFVVAFRNGERISLSEVTTVNPDYNENLEAYNASITGENLKKIYRIQLGAFKDNVPTDFLDKCLQIGQDFGLGDFTDWTQENLSRYLIGSFDNVDEAQSAAKKIKERGLEAFVLIQYGDQLIELKDEATFFKDK